MEDVIIIGGGPSALSAAIYLARYRRKVLLLTDSYGGQTATAGLIENYPGIKAVEGSKLISEMIEQAKEAGAKMQAGLAVTEIKKDKTGFKISTSDGSFLAKNVLITTGKNPRKLGLPDEDRLIGKGLSYCATCDGPLSRDKEVVIIGGGFAATKSALVLTKYARKITIININNKLTSETVTIEKIKNDKKISVLNNAKTIGFNISNGFISGIKYKLSDETKELSLGAQMVFVEIGQVPNTKSFKEIVNLTKKDEIIIDDSNQTSQRGIYAAGDVTNILAKQIVIAAGEGAKAAIAINSALEKS